MPQDAGLKGHKGIQAYHQNVGEGTPVVAVIGEVAAVVSPYGMD